MFSLLYFFLDNFFLLSFLLDSHAVTGNPVARLPVRWKGAIDCANDPSYPISQPVRLRRIPTPPSINGNLNAPPVHALTTGLATHKRATSGMLTAVHTALAEPLTNTLISEIPTAA